MNKNRIDGTSFGLSVGGVDRSDDVTNVTLEFENADSKRVSVAEARSGNTRDLFVRGDVFQNYDPAALYGYWQRNPGAEVPFRYAAYNNDVPTVTQPHTVGIMKPTSPLNVGTEAAVDGDSATSTFEAKVVSWHLDEGVTVPTILAVYPQSQPAGKIVQISGNRLTATTGVKFGTKDAAFNVYNDALVSVQIPDDAASGKINVVVTNDKGSSEAFSYTVA